MTDEWAPERIWLQRGMGEEGSHTWCEDRIGSDSIGEDLEEVEYIRANLASGQSAPAAWVLRMADGKLDLTDATDEPTDKNREWAAKNGHTYVALSADVFALLQEICR